MLHRTGRRSRGSDVETPCTTIRQQADDAEQAADVDELMGLEGAASTAYFGCLSGLVPPDVAFDGRSRRPPKDLANAALSYAYAILLAAGLETSLGVLHASTDKRRSLSLGHQRGRPAWPPRWRVGATGSRSPFSSCGWSPPNTTRCADRSPRSSTRPTTSSASTRCATPA